MSNGPPPSRWPGLLGAAALFCLVFAVYQSGVGNDFLYDDHVLITKPDAPESAADLLAVFGERHWYNLPYYRPLSRLTMVAQKGLHGNDATPFHLFNAVLIGLLAVVAYVFLRAPPFGIGPVPAWLAACVFTLHPIASSGVFPVVGRETLLIAAFVLGGLTAFLRAGPRAYGLALLLLACALFSKEQGIVLVVLFVAADVFGLSAEPPGRHVGLWLRRYTPVLGIVGGYLVVRLAVLGTGEYGIAAVEDPLGPLLSLAHAIQSWFLPFADLAFEPRLEAWWSPWRLVLACALGAGLLAAVGARWAEMRRTAPFWLAFALVAMAPTANLLTQEARFSERYPYLSMIALLALAARLTTLSWSRPTLRGGLSAAWVVVIVACTVVTLGRAATYADDLSFAEQWVRTNPNWPQAQWTLADALYRRERFEEALPHYLAASKLAQTADIYADMAQTLARLGRPREALDFYHRAVRVQPERADARFRLGRALQSTGRFDEAADQYETALQTEPRNVRYLFNLANTRSNLGELQDAVSAYRQALSIEPDYVNARYNLALVLERQGDLDAALGELRRVSTERPDRWAPRQKIASILVARPGAGEAEISEAIRLAESAVELTERNNAAALATLATTWAAAGRPERARVFARDALALAQQDGNAELAGDLRARLDAWGE